MGLQEIYVHLYFKVQTYNDVTKNLHQ